MVQSYMYVFVLYVGCGTCRAADGLARVVDDQIEARKLGLDERAERLFQRSLISFIIHL